jgi:hypothetical protein
MVKQVSFTFLFVKLHYLFVRVSYLSREKLKLKMSLFVAKECGIAPNSQLGPCKYSSICLLGYNVCLSDLVTAVAVFRNPITIPFCLTTDLLLNVLFSWLLVHLPSTFFLDVLFFFFPLVSTQ